LLVGKNEVFVVKSFYLKFSFSVLYNSVSKYLKLLYLSEPFVVPERRPQIRKKNKNKRFSFSRVTFQRKSSGVKRAYYRVNGYTTEPLRLLEADMPGASQFRDGTSTSSPESSAVTAKVAR